MGRKSRSKQEGGEGISEEIVIPSGSGPFLQIMNLLDSYKDAIETDSKIDETGLKNLESALAFLYPDSTTHNTKVSWKPRLHQKFEEIPVVGFIEEIVFERNSIKQEKLNKQVYFNESGLGSEKINSTSGAVTIDNAAQRADEGPGIGQQSHPSSGSSIICNDVNLSNFGFPRVTQWKAKTESEQTYSYDINIINLGELGPNDENIKIGDSNNLTEMGKIKVNNPSKNKNLNNPAITQNQHIKDVIFKELGDAMQTAVYKHFYDTATVEDKSVNITMLTCDQTVHYRNILLGLPSILTSSKPRENNETHGAKVGSVFTPETNLTKIKLIKLNNLKETINTNNLQIKNKLIKALFSPTGVVITEGLSRNREIRATQGLEKIISLVSHIIDRIDQLNSEIDSKIDQLNSEIDSDIDSEIDIDSLRQYMLPHFINRVEKEKYTFDLSVLNDPVFSDLKESLVNYFETLNSVIRREVDFRKAFKYSTNVTPSAGGGKKNHIGLKRKKSKHLKKEKKTPKKVRNVKKTKGTKRLRVIRKIKTGVGGSRLGEFKKGHRGNPDGNNIYNEKKSKRIDRTKENRREKRREQINRNRAELDPEIIFSDYNIFIYHLNKTTYDAPPSIETNKYFASRFTIYAKYFNYCDIFTSYSPEKLPKNRNFLIAYYSLKYYYGIDTSIDTGSGSDGGDEPHGNPSSGVGADVGANTGSGFEGGAGSGPDFGSGFGLGTGPGSGFGLGAGPGSGFEDDESMEYDEEIQLTMNELTMLYILELLHGNIGINSVISSSECVKYPSEKDVTFEDVKSFINTEARDKGGGDITIQMAINCILDDFDRDVILWNDSSPNIAKYKSHLKENVIEDVDLPQEYKKYKDSHFKPK